MARLNSAKVTIWEFGKVFSVNSEDEINDYNLKALILIPCLISSSENKQEYQKNALRTCIDPKEVYGKFKLI